MFARYPPLLGGLLIQIKYTQREAVASTKTLAHITRGFLVFVPASAKAKPEYI